MSSEQDILRQALEIDNPAERSDFIARMCGGDAALKSAVLRLLAEAGDGSNAAGDVTETRTSNESTVGELRAGVTIGPFRLMEQIGRGGMGVVYAADQQKPVRRRVALKIIKPGLDSREVIHRFEAERQALALMDHPNIARVLDAGETDDGRPYFVMELVRGVPITDYCDEQKLPSEERLRLFADVCRAIQHAHQRGVIHRDIKPGNVLVTSSDDQPSVKVIDFGVAKATHLPLTDSTVYTKFSQMIGTPLYMSPEQAAMSGVDVDTRTDVYSLGVMLYELLTGATPFDRRRIKEAAFDEMRRIIREEEPPRPSTKLSSLGDSAATISQQRRTDPRQLVQQIRGDLDWIVMKALEKDRQRRYATANELAQDVERYLTDQPVAASPPSAWYRVAKFYRRNRAATITATVIAVLLILGSVGTTTGMLLALQANNDLDDALTVAKQAKKDAEENEVLAKQEAGNARRQAEIAEAVNEFLNVDLLSAVAPSVEVGKGRDVRMFEVLMEAAKRIERESKAGGKFADKPLIEAAIRKTLGKTFRELGELELARPHFERALKLHRLHAGAASREALADVRELARLLRLTSEFREGESMLRAALKTSRAEFGDEDELTVSLCGGLGNLLIAEIRMEEAAPLLEEQRRGLTRIRGADDLQTLHVRMQLAQIRRSRGQWKESLEDLEDVLKLALTRFGSEDLIVFKLYNEIGSVQRRLQLYAESAENRRNALVGYRRVYGDEHPYTLTIISNLGVALHMAERPVDAAPHLEEALAGRVKVLGETHSDSLFSKCYLAFNLAVRDEDAQALQMVNEAVDTAEKNLPANDWNIGDCLAMKGRILRIGKQYQQADEVLEKAYQQLSDSLGPYHGYTYNALMNAVNVFADWEQHEGHPDLTTRSKVWRDRLADYNRHREELKKKREAAAASK